MKRLVLLPVCAVYFAFCVAVWPLWFISCIFRPNRPSIDIKKTLRIEAIEEPHISGLRGWFIRLINGSDKKYRLVDDYEFVIDGERYRVRHGFGSDGVSNIRFLYLLYGTPWTGPQRWAGVPHDAAYAGVLERYNIFLGLWGRCYISRKDSDKLFLGILKARNASRFRYRGMYRGVRLFGKSHYNYNLLVPTVSRG